MMEKLDDIDRKWSGIIHKWSWGYFDTYQHNIAKTDVRCTLFSNLVVFIMELSF